MNQCSKENSTPPIGALPKAAAIQAAALLEMKSLPICPQSLEHLRQSDVEGFTFHRAQSTHHQSNMNHWSLRSKSQTERVESIIEMIFLKGSNIEFLPL